MRGQSRSRSSPRRPLAIAAAAAIAAVVSGGCGEDETPSTATLRIAVTEPSAHRFSYTAPRSVRAGLVKMTLVNRGEKPHKAQLWRILDDHSVEEALRVRRPLPKWLIFEGGVGVTEPGATESVIQQLRPGRYYIAGRGSERGRVAPFRVVGEAGDGELPSANGSIVTKEYSFTASGLKAGTNSIELLNEGLEPHHAVIAPVERGSSVPELRNFLRGKGPSPVGDVVDLEVAQETSVLEQGQKQVVQLRLKRGRYALLCFVPDRKGGPTHVAKGMVDAVTVR